MLWDAIDIRSAFAHRKPPAATHLCIGILIMEGVVKQSRLGFPMAFGGWAAKVTC